MRIAIIAPPWVPVPPSAYGGIETMLDTLARGLDSAGHRVTLFTTGDSTCPVEKKWVFDTAPGIAGAGPSVELRHVIDAYEQAGEFDVVHDHTLSGPVYADRFPWLPVVTTNHGPFLSDLGPLYRAVSDRVPVIAISHHQATTAQDVNIAAVIHHGLDLGEWPVGTGDGGYALFLGRMNPDKGVHHAARAARAAGVPLRIAAKMSEPPEFAYFESAVRPLLGADVEFVGEVGRTAKRQLLGEAVCLLNPIDWPEPFGMVMIEALASGTPVVTTSIGSAPEIVEDGVTGYLVGSRRELRDVLKEVASLDRGVCRKAAEERFSAELMVERHVSVYEQLIAGGSPTGSLRAAIMRTCKPYTNTSPTPT
ncbi:MAG TPA: glycosyltransferase family 4 protein [Acidimicrobiales bacterium]|nr:glycosyltransferase family 4 protein [Acidimicrobiales bacterium]